MPTKKEIVVDLHGVKNASDLMYRIRKAFNLFNYVNESVYQARIDQNDHSINWSAFSDEIGDLSFPDDPDVKEVYLILLGMGDAVNSVSQDVYSTLLRVLTSNTDPAQRVDGINFFFQVRW